MDCEWPNVKTVNESSEGYKNGVKSRLDLIKDKGEPIPATFNEAKAKLTFPLTLEFKNLHYRLNKVLMIS